MAVLASLLPLAEQQFTDGSGKPLAAGSVYFYVPGTTTLKTTWADPGQVTPNPNPVTLDANGRAIVYGAGAYRQVAYDAAGNLQWDQVTAAPVTSDQLTQGVAAFAASLNFSGGFYLQGGSAETDINGSVTVTFDNAFASQPPVVLITAFYGAANSVNVGSASATQFVARSWYGTAAAPEVPFTWLAIGQSTF